MIVSINPVYQLSINCLSSLAEGGLIDSTFMRNAQNVNKMSINCHVYHLFRQTIDKLADKLTHWPETENAGLSIVYLLSPTKEKKKNKKKECARARAMIDTPSRPAIA